MKILDWDTTFFGFRVARIEFQNEDQFEADIKKAKEDNVKLIYCFAETKNRLVEQYGELVDEKVTYYKKLENDIVFAPNHILIEEYSALVPTKELYNLAIQSGVYSRFNIDSRISTEKFQDLYRTWIENSVKKTFAQKVLVAKENNKISGMITLGEKNGRGDIGLIAVNLGSRGKGIAKSLMSATEIDFRTKFKEAQVVTQKKNTLACQLYEYFGYREEKIDPIYHIWL